MSSLISNPQDVFDHSGGGDSEEKVLTDEQKLDLARALMLQSPPGELLQVASDVRTLLNDDALLNSIALDVFREYNMEQMVAVSLPESSGQVLITKAGEIDSAHFLDPKRNQVVTVDHIKQTCIEVRPAEEHENTVAVMQNLRNSTEEELSSYAAECFPSAQVAVYGKLQGSSQRLTMCISSAKFNARNFWNGRWRSLWVSTLDPTFGEWLLKGNVIVVAHYFEEGNVQLQTKHEYECMVPSKGAEADAAALVYIVRVEEQAFLNKMGETYTNLSETTFKDLRRTLPVTRTKFPWSNKAHSLAAELKRAR